MSFPPITVHREPGAAASAAIAPTSPPEAPRGPSFQSVLKHAAEDLAEGERFMRQALRVSRRQDVSPAQLVAIQAGVYRYGQELELAGRLVDKATSAVRTTLQSQQ